MLETRTHPLTPKESLAAYLMATLRVNVTLAPWNPTRALPVFLARLYDLQAAAIAGRTCVFMLVTEAIDSTPLEIRKHMDQIGVSDDEVLIYVPTRLGRHTRARLIEQGVPFVVPGNQLFIPQLAMDLRDHFRAADRQTTGRLSPAAQVVLFHHLIGRHDETTPSSLAVLLPYTPMTIGRALDELAGHGLAKVERAGREKTVSYPDGRAIILEHAKTLLRQPKRAQYAVNFASGAPLPPLAGESALAEVTNLAAPATPVYAIEGRQWSARLIAHGLEPAEVEDEAEAIVELWIYDPAILMEDGRVDRASLYAQFWNHPDERVAQAAFELLETFA